MLYEMLNNDLAISRKKEQLEIGFPQSSKSTCIFFEPTGRQKARSLVVIVKACQEPFPTCQHTSFGHLNQ